MASRRHLRSARRHYLVVPRHSLSSYGRQSFDVAGPTACNSLSDDLRDPTLNTDSFRRLLKTSGYTQVSHFMCYINTQLTHLLAVTISHIDYCNSLLQAIHLLLTDSTMCPCLNRLGTMLASDLHVLKFQTVWIHLWNAHDNTLDSTQRVQISTTVLSSQYQQINNIGRRPWKEVEVSRV